MSEFRHYIALVPGIHDTPGSREVAHSVIAPDRDTASREAADHYGLHQLPPGSRVIAVDGAVDTRTHWRDSTC